jgi:hypothetical protein
MKLQWSKTFDRMTWEDAVKFCEELEFNRKKDWRLPTRVELLEVHDSGENPYGDTEPGFYWSSTTYAGTTGIAWAVSFYDGAICYGGKSNTSYVRAVRERKESE